MVASAQITIETKPLEAMQRGINNVEQLVTTVAGESVRLATQEHMPQIKKYPPERPRIEFRFATPKSRRYYFAVIAKKNGGRYQRTGGLRDSWSVRTEQGQGVYTATLSSSMNATLFVVGNLLGKRQVPGHMDTKWQLVKKPIEAWQGDVLVTFFVLYERRVGNLKEVAIL